MTADAQQLVQSPARQNKSADARFEEARRHSRYVSMLKIGLPVVALMIVGGFAGWVWLATPRGFTADVAGSAVADGKLVMANPKLNGFTKDNLPYVMTAERAIQDLSNAAVVTLENIAAQVPMEADNFADISAEIGLFDNENNTLDITSPVTIKTGDGMLAELQSAFVDMNSGEVVSSQPVRITMNGSTLEADTMTVEDRGRIILFESRVRMTLLPDELKSGESNE